MNKTKEEIVENVELAADINAIVAAMLSSFGIETEIDIATRNKTGRGWVRWKKRKHQKRSYETIKVLYNF